MRKCSLSPLGDKNPIHIDVNGIYGIYAQYFYGNIPSSA
jgi:hypothetical protein